jgi:hypothetical protein
MLRLHILQLLPCDELQLRRSKFATVLPSLCSTVRNRLLAAHVTYQLSNDRGVKVVSEQQKPSQPTQNWRSLPRSTTWANSHQTTSSLLLYMLISDTHCCASAVHHVAYMVL